MDNSLIWRINRGRYCFWKFGFVPSGEVVNRLGTKGTGFSLTAPVWALGKISFPLFPLATANGCLAVGRWSTGVVGRSVGH